MAILSDSGFDATQVDPSTVTLDGQPVRVKNNGSIQAHVEDVNADGLDDLVLQIVDVAGTYSSGDTTGTLSGETFGGSAIVGSDSICVVPK